MTAHHDPNADAPEARQETAREKRKVRRLIERAGRRPEPPKEDLAAIKLAFREAWRKQVAAQPDAGEGTEPKSTSRAATTAAERPARGASRWPNRTLPVAASLLLALGFAGWWLLAGPSSQTGPVVATATTATGTRADGAALEAGQPLRAGGRLEVAANGSAALRLDGGVELRVAAGSEVRLASSRVIELDRGALYVDTGDSNTAAGAAGLVEIRTALGNAHDIGTRFEVRLLDVDGLRVRVRDGEVEVRLGEAGDVHTAAAGSELLVRAGGGGARRPIAVYGEAWAWTVAAAPSLDVNGRTVREVLDWAARETGLELRFDSAATEAAAADTIVHGTIPGLTPDRAPAVVLPSAGLTFHQEDGVLRVEELRRSS